MRGGNLDPMRASSPMQVMSQGRRPSLALAMILFAIVVVHRSALRAPFFADDYLFLEQVRNRSLGSALLAPDPIGNFLRPVGRSLWFWLVARIGGERPALFHALNLGLLLGMVTLLYALAK